MQADSHVGAEVPKPFSFLTHISPLSACLIATPSSFLPPFTESAPGTMIVSPLGPSLATTLPSGMFYSHFSLHVS